MEKDFSKYTEKELDRLTTRQKYIFSLAAAGRTQAEIARIEKCTKQNINEILAAGIKRMECPKEKSKKVKQKGKKISNNYEKYRNIELDCLTEHEKEIFLLRLSGLTYQEIATKVNISVNTVGAILQYCRDKLEGKGRWYQRNPARARENRKKNWKNDPASIKKRTDQHRKWSAKNAEKLREYNKRYYREHKEEILARQKSQKEEDIYGKIQ